MANREAGTSSNGAAGDAGIRVFRDDEELRVGEVIGGELLRAIDDSILYIPIFSRGYATSKWCLREIARMVENTDASNRSEGIKKKILPIFFDVEPDDVKLKTPLYRDALLEHEKKVPEEVEAWRKALVEVDEIKGWNLNRDEGQGHLIKLVVEDVLEKLWISEEIVEILKTKEGKKQVQAFDLDGKYDSKVWSLMKMAIKLKVLALRKCFSITRTPDFSKCLMLERLTLERCDNLTEIDCSIGRLKCLIDLNINDCSRLEELPKEIGGLEKLKRFSLTDCYRVSKLPDSVGKLVSLTELYLSNMRVTSLPDSICRLKCLSTLNVSRMPITELPDSIAALVKLESFSLISTKIRELPISIGKLKSLRLLDFSCKMIPILTGKGWKLPSAIGMLENLEEIHAERCEELEGEIPDEVGNLLLLRILNLSDTRIDTLPSTISKLTRLQKLDLSRCHKIKELPKLPTSLICLRVESRSLLSVPNLSNLTNLEELLLSDGSRLSDGFRNTNGSDLMRTSNLSWIGRLSKLNKLELRLWNNPTPPTELSTLSLLEELTLSSLDLQPLEQLPSSLLGLRLDNFNSTRSLSSNLRSLSMLMLCGSRVKEIQLHGLLQLRNLTVECCELLERLSILSSLKNLIDIRVCKCSGLVDIQFQGVMESLQYLSIEDCESVKRLRAEVPNDLGSSSELAFCGERVSVLSTALKKLKECSLVSCGKLLEIQVVGMLESLEYFLLYHCHAMERLGGLANIKNLRHLAIGMCSQLRAVEGLDKLEILDELNIFGCSSLERPIDVCTAKIPDECRIYFSNCGELLDSDPVGDNNVPFERYREMIFQGTADTQSETKNSELETEKEEAKMEGDAKEPKTELQLQFHPSASSRDHEISEEPPIDHVIDQQNQTMEQDLNLISLDALPPPRTFSNRIFLCVGYSLFIIHLSVFLLPSDDM
ncbi:hypothetical protein NL676_016150 [Syzygium grande]|nr:hypothetical protein NL676_016150 [Syzygium grande]